MIARIFPGQPQQRFDDVLHFVHRPFPEHDVRYDGVIILGQRQVQPTDTVHGKIQHMALHFQVIGDVFSDVTVSSTWFGSWINNFVSKYRHR